ncbi:MAG: ATP-binding protein [Candidatus Nitrosopolaris sp.]|jgi:replication-associated recombination protein RarA
MKLFNVFRRTHYNNFDDIEGYDDIKNIVTRALNSDENYNLLFTGPPASSKTLFLMGIMDREKNCVYFDGSNSTNRMLDVLEEERPNIVCIDEIDKLPKQFQNKLLNLMENGHVKVDQKNCQYDFEFKGLKVFATSNELNRLSKPLQSRFRRLNLPKYTHEQFLNVAITVCPKLKEEVAEMIGEEVWKQQGDIRDVISISKLVQKNDGPEEIAEIMATLNKYGDE